MYLNIITTTWLLLWIYFNYKYYRSHTTTKNHPHLPYFKLMEIKQKLAEQWEELLTPLRPLSVAQ